MKESSGSSIEVSERLLAKLRDFVAIRSLAGELEENQSAVNFVCDCLCDAGFEVRVEGRDSLEQPVIVAHRPAVNSQRKVLLYGHYDVAPVLESEEWCVDEPYTVSRVEGRLYGRGVADNKGTLLTRLLALAKAHRAGQSLPALCWLIQGKEEVLQVCAETAAIFRKEMEQFPAEVFLDETGFNDLDSGEPILFLWSRSEDYEDGASAKEVVEALGQGRVENRHLNKLNGGGNCPLLSSMPTDGLYLGFGPNDRLHNIHRADESLDESRLAAHGDHFVGFLSRYARC